MQDSLLLSTLTVSQSKVSAADPLPKTVLHGTDVAMYIVGQERRLVDPPSQVVAGVRTVTTNMDGRDALPRMSRPFAFLADQFFKLTLQTESESNLHVRIDMFVL
jgi:hypothetical protein